MSARELQPIRIQATNYDGKPHWSHAALLLHHEDGLVVTQTTAGLAIENEGAGYVSPYNTNGHYWAERWFNVIRLEEPGVGLAGYYCNIASPATFDGKTLSYIDLQLDVRAYAQPDGSLTYAVLDEDEFEAARARYGYPPDLVARCRDAVRELLRMIEARSFPFAPGRGSGAR